MNRTVSIKTLGCKLNQYESETIQSDFKKQGWDVVPFGKTADVVIINTCTVTDRSDKKCRGYIRQGAKFSKSGKSIVMGCMAESSEKSLNEMDQVLEVFNNKVKDGIVKSVVSSFEDDNENSFSGMPKLETQLIKQSRKRAFLKIQDGCDGECSYCIVPTVRGIPKSRAMRDVINQAKELIDQGFPELVLTGITIGKYNDEGKDLADLTNEIVELDGDFRIRITSIEPNHVTEKLMKVMQHYKVCNHIHLPLQSGSSKILKLMKRPYTVKEFKDAVDRLRYYNPLISIGSDVIVGFPGETKEDFDETLEVVKYSNFSTVHQFTFSSRSGTEAADMKQVVTSKEINDRSSELREISEELSFNYRKLFFDKEVQTVVESRKDGTFHAISDNYLRIKLENVINIPSNGFNKIKITNIDTPVLLGEMV